MREMTAYCRYLYQQVEPMLGRSVWEVGLGHGTYTRLLLQQGRRVLATDIDTACLEQARNQLGSQSQLTLAHVDLRDASSIRCQADFRADSIICFNVLEHIEDHVEALRLLRESVLPTARLGLVVPAMPGLYGRMDREAGHFRRYSHSSLKSALQLAGWSIDSLRYINALGAVGWWSHNRLRQNAGLQDTQVNAQMRVADRWLPKVARWTDPWLASIAGLSLVAVASQAMPSPRAEENSN
jgi:SAM-dependent methyltransferase